MKVDYHDKRFTFVFTCPDLDIQHIVCSCMLRRLHNTMGGYFTVQTAVRLKNVTLLLHSKKCQTDCLISAVQMQAAQQPSTLQLQHQRSNVMNELGLFFSQQLHSNNYYRRNKSQYFRQAILLNALQLPGNSAFSILSCKTAVTILSTFSCRNMINVASY